MNYTQYRELFFDGANTSGCRIAADFATHWIPASRDRIPNQRCRFDTVVSLIREFYSGEPSEGSEDANHLVEPLLNGKPIGHKHHHAKRYCDVDEYRLVNRKGFHSGP